MQVKKGKIKSISGIFSSDIYRFKIEYTNGDWGYLYRWENVTLKKGDELFYTLRGRRMELTDDPKIANMNLNERIEYFSKKEQK